MEGTVKIGSGLSLFELVIIWSFSCLVIVSLGGRIAVGLSSLNAGLLNFIGKDDGRMGIAVVCDVVCDTIDADDMGVNCAMLSNTLAAVIVLL